ncbi:unnamed protein product [Cyprideis torosa]|uniref:Uncharacterized protein n=1 Tax=Cyprideis torosa TaxID=163714 RepID=A0A7R8ZQ19_9CRUS|nr:unnamed protein product [Cyprideis torosa]CAG0889614.1 unnamed protein product [Cyprideis torosa]
MPPLGNPDSGSNVPIESMQNPYQRESIKCILCRHKVPVDYKNVRLLAQFISPYTGFLYKRNITRLCTKQQERVEREVRKARQAGLMAIALKEPE